MARKRKAEEELENTTAKSAAAPSIKVPSDDQGDLPPLVEQAPRKPPSGDEELQGVKAAAAVARAKQIASEVPAIQRYRVKKGGPFLHRGMMTQMREGKIIRGVDYDLAKLKDAGIEIEEV